MTEEPRIPSEPDWTRRCTPKDLDTLDPGDPYMLRTSDDPDSPWRHVKTRHVGWFKDEKTGLTRDYITFEFHGDDAERMVNETDEIEIGLIRPPWWSADTEPPEWPVRD